MKPFLFLDVDGVLNIDKPHEKFDTFSKTKVSTDTAVVCANIDVTHKGHRIRYDSTVPDQMQELSTLYQIVWDSHGWSGHEDCCLSPLFKLPKDLPQLDVKDSPRDEKDYPWMPSTKIKAIQRFLTTQNVYSRFAIVDDKIGPIVRVWLLQNYPSGIEDYLIVQPNRYRGLEPKHFKTLKEFAQ